MAKYTFSSHFRNASVIRGLLFSSIITVGLFVGVYLTKTTEILRPSAQTVECSDWCAGDDQCFQSNGRRPNSGEPCTFAFCASGTSPCCANGICGTKEVGGSTGGDSGMCDSSSLTAKYCRNKPVGYKPDNVCTCTRTTGTLCSCVTGSSSGGSTHTPTPTPSTSSTSGCVAGNQTFSAGECGCSVHGYETKRCVYYNNSYLWTSLNQSICERQCAGSVPDFGQGASCDTIGDYPEPECVGKTVGQSCGSISNYVCVVNEPDTPRQYCLCAQASGTHY